MAAKRSADEAEREAVGSEEYSASKMGDFASYFKNKLVKLDTQSREQAGKLDSNIFHGCTCYITGLTQPSVPTLKRLIAKNGGRVCAYLSGKSAATHIIAESLTARKNMLYSKWRVVKPAWIVESINSGQLLDWTKFSAIPTCPPQSYSELELGQESELESLSDNGNVYEDAPMSPPDSSERHGRDNLDFEEEIEEDKAVTWILRERQRVNCLDPDFVRNYYNKSRLHYLSTRKLVLRARCREINSPVTNAQGERILLHVDFDSFFVSIALKSRPELREKPMCVSHGSDGSDIASCNYPARAKGVHNGMWVGRARTLCPELVCLPYDFDEYTRCSDALYSTLIDMQPDYICAVSVDEAVVDVSSKVAAGKSARELAADIQNAVRLKTGIEISIGAGANILLCRLALKMAKPAGFAEIPLRTAPEQVADIAVRDVPGVGHHIASKLAELGVNHVKDLKNWPLQNLQQRLGKSMGRMLADTVQGVGSDDISTLDTLPKSVGVEIGWGVRTIYRDEMEAFAKNVAAELFHRLHQIKGSADLLTIKIYRKAKDAPFIAPKYMGHGMCDTPSKSRRINSHITLADFEELLTALLNSFECPPLEFRGLGLNFRLQNPTNLRGSLFQTPTQKVASKVKREFVALQPRRRAFTLTQSPSKPKAQQVNLSVFNELPAHIRREILRNEDEFNLELPSEESSQFPRSQAALLPDFNSKGHVEFLGVSSPQEIRGMLRQWTSTTLLPCAEDVEQVQAWLKKVINDDAGWTRALSMVNWLGKMAHTADWKFLHRLLRDTVSILASQRTGGLGRPSRIRTARKRKV